MRARGGMGVVYRARDRSTGQLVALKRSLHRDVTSLVKVLHESAAEASLLNDVLTRLPAGLDRARRAVPLLADNDNGVSQHAAERRAERH